MSMILNAIIKSAVITNDDHGLLTAWLTLDYGGSGQGFGGYALYLPKSFNHHKMMSCAGHFIWRCMEVAEVSEWGKLPGKTIRVKKTGEWGDILAIGHIIKDDWFSPKEDFNPEESPPMTPEREQKSGVCIHGALRRQCEACDLAEQVDALEAKCKTLEKVARLADLLWRDASKVDLGNESYYETSPRLMELMADALAAPPREECVCGEINARNCPVHANEHELDNPPREAPPHKCGWCRYVEPIKSGYGKCRRPEGFMMDATIDPDWGCTDWEPTLPSPPASKEKP